jgi:chitinase
MKIPVLILILFFLLDCGEAICQKKSSVIIGYVNSPENNIDFKSFDPKGLTHLIYAFAHIVDNRILLSENDMSYLARFVQMKEKTPELKVLVSIGGWTGNTEEFYRMAENSERRKVFISSVLEFIHKTKIDGIDLDWEFPGYDWSGGSILSMDANRLQDKKNFNDLLIELKTAFVKISSENNQKLVLTTTTSSFSEINNVIDLKTTAQYVDYINIMAYDFYMSWLPFPIFFTGHQSNLFDTKRNPRTISAELVVKYHLKKGVPSNKLVLGIPIGFYNYWSGVNPKNNGLYQFAINKKRVSSSEIKSMIANGSLKRFWDNKAKVPYYWNANNQIFASGEDSKSIRWKCKYLKKEKLGGAMFWYYQKDQLGLIDELISRLN